MPEYLHNIPEYVLNHMLRSESKRDEGFSDPAVRVSLYLDVDRCNVRSQRDYARIWGWTRDKVRYHWEDIWQDVALWATANGRQAYTDFAEKLPDRWLCWVREHPGYPPGRPPPTPQKAGNLGDTGRSTPREPPSGTPPSPHHTKQPTSSQPTSSHTEGFKHTSSDSPDSETPPVDTGDTPEERAASEEPERKYGPDEWPRRFAEAAWVRMASFDRVLPSVVRRGYERDPPGTMDKWADVFRLLHEQDGYEVEEIQAVIRWLLAHDDRGDPTNEWITEGMIASIPALRKKTRTGDRYKFDVMYRQYQADKTSTNGHDEESLTDRFNRFREVGRRALDLE